MKLLTKQQGEVLKELYWLNQNHGACDHRGPAKETGWASTSVVSKLVGFRCERQLVELSQRGLVDRYDYVTGRFNHFTTQDGNGRFCYRITKGGYDWVITKGYGIER